MSANPDTIPKGAFEMTMTSDERETLRAFASRNWAGIASISKAVDVLCELALREDQARTAQRPSTSLLKSPTAHAPSGCHCTTTCAAPVVMGRQQPCRRDPPLRPGEPIPSEAMASGPDPIRATGIALLEATERHIFADECLKERSAFRAALGHPRHD